MKTNRRLFLKHFLQSTAGLTFARQVSYANLLNLPAAKDIEIADCIVIGAGMAGLVAARDLSFSPRQGGRKARNKVIVLESSHRIGGRILTLEDERFGGPVELGADYIHREPSPNISIWDDINLYKPEIIKYPRMLKGLMYYDGWEDHLRSHLTMASGWNVKDVLTFSQKIDSYAGKENISAKAWLERQTYSRFGRNLVDFYFTGHLPGSLNKISLKGFSSDRISEQLKEWNEYGFKNGYGNFLKQLTNGIGPYSGEHLDIRYNSPVAAVKYGLNGVEVTTRAGQVFRAKTAIIAVPIGILKSGDIEFNPPLPESKKQALSWIEVGDRAKLILKFKKKFWPDDAVFLTRIDNRREMARTYFIPHANDPVKNNILSIYFCGEEADKIAKMSDTEIIKALARDFDRMYPKEAKKAGGTIFNLLELSGSGFPTYLKWQWSQDPHTKGSVSYLRAGSEENLIPVIYARRILADSSTTPNLFWAGEATAFGDHTQPSTTHGAHHTGRRAAQEVKQLLLTQK